MDLKTLKGYIKTRLENLSNIQVYDNKSEENPTFPYLIFKISSTSYLTRRRKTRILEVDYWDNKTDDEDILNASEYVKNGRLEDETEYIGMDYSTQNEDNGFYQSYIEFEGEIPNQDYDISHINQRFILLVD